MFGRIAARLLVSALKSPHVQAAAVEVTRYAARRATAYLLKRLRSSSTLNDFSGAKHVTGPVSPF
jgi:hypothetical protein